MMYAKSVDNAVTNSVVSLSGERADRWQIAFIATTGFGIRTQWIPLVVLSIPKMTEMIG